MAGRKSAAEKAAPTVPTRTSKRVSQSENQPPPAKRVKREEKPVAIPKASKPAAKAPARPSKTTRAPTKTSRASALKAPARGKPASTKAKAAPAPPPKKEARVTAPRPPKASLNVLPSPPEHPRPANQIFVWGAGNFGQFGMGPDHLGEFDKPKKNPWIEKKMDEGVFGGPEAGIEAVVAGGLHTMFIDERGTIWTCGVNDDAALGRTTKDVPDPENPESFIDIDTLTSIPYPIQSLVDEKFRAVSIAAGDSICAALSSEGELRVWGSFRGNEGSLGFSDGSKYQFKPSPILTLPKDEKAVQVAAGNNHLIVLTNFGHIYTWGAGEQGQLGRKILERRKIHGTNPEKVTLHSRLRKAVVVGAGNYTSYAVDEKGTVWGWGLNNMGQTGTGYEGEDDTIVPQPVEVDGLSKEELGGATIVQIAGGEHHTLFLTSDGRVFACGRCNAGQLGLPEGHAAITDSPEAGMVATPTQVPFPDADDPIVYISAGTHNNAAVTQNGALYVWGEGNQGELGVGDDTEANTPTVVVRREGGSWKAVAVSCGGQHTLGLFRKKIAS